MLGSSSLQDNPTFSSIELGLMRRQVSPWAILSVEWDGKQPTRGSTIGGKAPMGTEPVPVGLPSLSKDMHELCCTLASSDVRASDEASLPHRKMIEGLAYLQGFGS